MGAAFSFSVMYGWSRAIIVGKFVSSKQFFYVNKIVNQNPGKMGIVNMGGLWL